MKINLVFRKNNSTIYALMQITERIKETVDKGKFGYGIFIDLRKVFDTVNHDILLLKLEHYGVRENMLKWFKSYLSNRKQYVYLNGESSEIKEIACGYRRVLFWVHYFFYYTLMIFLTSLKYWTFIYLLMIPTYIMKAITLINWKEVTKSWANYNFG